MSKTRRFCLSKVRAVSDSLPAIVICSSCLLLTAGCASTLDALRSEESIPHLAAAKKNFDSLPRKTSFVPTSDAGGRIVNVAVHEIGNGSRDTTLVMIHGALSDHRIWRFLGGNLGRDYDLLLVDLPGCGASDQPDPSTLEPEGYALTALADRTLQALQTKLRSRKKTTRVVLVGHSLGGAVSLRMLGDPALRETYSDVLKTVERCVLLSPFDVAIVKPDPDYKAIVELGSLELKLASWLGILEESIAQEVYTASVVPGVFPREEAETWIEIFEDPDRFQASRAIILQAVPWNSDKRPNWPRIEGLVSGYKNIDIPCLILWGARDETMPLSMGYKLQAEIPNASLRVIAQGKHCLQVESPRVCASYMREFLAANRT